VARAANGSSGSPTDADVLRAGGMASTRLAVRATLPEPMRMIYQEACRLLLPESNLHTLQPAWAAHVTRAQQRIRGLHIEDGGEVLYLGGISPGCQACKEGSWDCIFTTMRCNLDCGFCYSPHDIPKDYVGSHLGSTPEQIDENHAKTRITGISFSGGEPFSEPQRLFEWVAWFTTRHPDKYYWVYTNGLLAGEQKIRRLAEMGVHEIRFNLAATGYDHPVALGNLEIAGRLIPNLTVEIPAIPEDTAKVLSCLARWSALGVRFLNLHELMYEPGTNSESMPGVRQPIVTADGHRSAIHPDSRALTLAVMQRVQEEGLPLAVNDCSLQSKIRQLRGRRKCLAPLMKEPHEKLVGGSVYESYCVYGDGIQARTFHPDALDEMRRRYADGQFVRLVRTAPLSIHDPEKWISFEPLGH
jgi:pyruvate formate-lyase activating enzyme-like uncharacterized protein